MGENSFTSSFKYFIRIAIFLLIFIFVYIKMGERYESVAQKNVINKFSQERFNDFYELPKDSLDMVFIGSSHSYCTFDPENFDETLNISSFQMGTPLQHPDTSYYVLNEVFNYQKPKVVVFEIYWDVLDDDFEMKQANSFFEVLNNDKMKEEYIEKVFPLGEKAKYFILPIRYQQDYFAYEAYELEKKLEEKYDVEKKKEPEINGIEEYRSKGYVYCDIVMPESEYNETNQFKGLDGKDFKISEVQRIYIEKMVDFCKEHNTEIVFVTAPVANVSLEYIKNYEIINNEITELASSLNVKYIDYNIINKEENIVENDNFRDDAHLNDSGAKIINSHFLKWLKDNTKI